MAPKRKLPPKKDKKKQPSSTAILQQPYSFKPMTPLYRAGNWQLIPLFRMSLQARFNTLLTDYGAAFDSNARTFQSFYDQFMKDYIIECRLRFQFKRLLNAYRIHKMNRRSTDNIDPITLNPIREPIYVYSVKERRRYLFEADSLNKSLRRNLYHSQYTIPQPKEPINVITNRPFTRTQLLSIVEQLRSTKQRMEDLSIYRTLQFNIPVWTRYMHRQLRITAVREELMNQTSLDGQDMLLDFIKDSMMTAHFPLTERFELILDHAVQWYPEHTLLGMFRTLCMKTYEATLFKIEIHEILMMQFAKLFSRHYPKCGLWSQVEDRLVADSEALRLQEGQ